MNKKVKVIKSNYKIITITKTYLDWCDMVKETYYSHPLLLVFLPCLLIFNFINPVLVSIETITETEDWNDTYKYALKSL